MLSLRVVICFFDGDMRPLGVVPMTTTLECNDMMEMTGRDKKGLRLFHHEVAYSLTMTPVECSLQGQVVPVLGRFFDRQLLVIPLRTRGSVTASPA